MAEKYTPLFAWREYRHPFTGPGPVRVADLNPRRVAIEFVLDGGNAVWVSTNADTVRTTGRILIVAGDVVEYRYKDWGDMVRAAWYADPTDAAVSFHVREAWLLR